MELVSVAAIADNLVIGDEGEIPWESLPEDKQQYRGRIASHPVILGRVTFESMLEDLPGAAQIVLSRRSQEFGVDTAYHAESVAEAIDIAESLAEDVAYVIGGAKIYELFMPYLDRMILSRVPEVHDGDAHYPVWDEEEWTLEEQIDCEGFTLEEWVRTDPA